MNQPSVPPPTGTPPSSDRKIKIGFLIALAVAAAAVMYIQRRPPALPTNLNAMTDLSAALKLAAGENRNLAIFFLHSPPTEADRKQIDALFKDSINERTLREGRFVVVRVDVDTPQSPLAQQYRIRTLPTLLALKPNGTEYNRCETFVSAVDFRSGFLTGAKSFAAP